MQISKLWTAPEVNPINNKAKWVPVLVKYHLLLFLLILRLEPLLCSWKSILLLLVRFYDCLSFVVRFSAAHSKNPQDRSQTDYCRHCQRKCNCARGYSTCSRHSRPSLRPIWTQEMYGRLPHSWCHPFRSRWDSYEC